MTPDPKHTVVLDVMGADCGPEIIIKAHRDLLGSEKPLSRLVVGDYALLQAVSEAARAGVEHRL